jgi:hypothetical protein
MGRGGVSVEAGKVSTLGRGGGRRVGFSSVKKRVRGGRQDGEEEGLHYVARLAVVVVVLSGTWRGAGAAACTGSFCCNVVIPKLDPLTTTRIDGSVCSEGS